MNVTDSMLTERIATIEVATGRMMSEATQLFYACTGDTGISADNDGSQEMMQALQALQAAQKAMRLAMAKRKAAQATTAHKVA